MAAASIRQACRVDALLICRGAAAAVSEQPAVTLYRAGMCTLEWLFHYKVMAIQFTLKLLITCSHLCGFSTDTFRLHTAGDCGVPA
jgi:hypothetical protein